MDADAFEIIPEEEGYFFKIPFDGESDTTLIFVAERDFSEFKEMAADSDDSWEDFRDELFELVEHTGHDEEHSLSRETTGAIRQAVSDYEEQD